MTCLDSWVWLEYVFEGEAWEAAEAAIEEVTCVTVVYWAHLTGRDRLQETGGEVAFARREPDRPNHLSLCTGLIVDVSDGELHVTGLDAVDGSPVIDLKPASQSER